MASLSNTSEANAFSFGQHGSAVIKTASTAFVPPPGYVVAALQVLEADVTFTKLYSEDSSRFVNTLSASHNTANDTAASGAVTDNDFVDMDGNASAKVGDFVYHRSNTAITFIGKVKAVGKDSNGDPNASMIQLDRKVTLPSAATLSFTTREKGGGAGSWDTGLTMPVGSTLFGRWTLVETGANGTVIAYLAPANIDPTKVEV